MNTKEMSDTYVASTYKRADLTISHGVGSLLYSEDGTRYIDLGSGIAVNTFGACDPIWRNAVSVQLGKIQHTSNLYYTAPQAELARTLCERTGFRRVFFGNSGAEANECAIKTARKYASDKYGAGHHTIVTLRDSFHGRTVTTLSATGQDVFHKDFGPFTDGFVHAVPNDIADLERLFDEYPCCAFMAELIQGEGGVRDLDPEYVRAAAELAKSRDILFIVDEVQTGNGRTGELYSYMNFGIMPDIITTAKGLAGGLPFSATLLGEKCCDVLGFGSHGSTFGGNPICAAAAISTLDRIDDKLLADVRMKGGYIRNALKYVPEVISISGLGLMLGIECKKSAAEVAAGCLERGVIVLTAHDRVRLLPALNIPLDLLSKALEILKEVIIK